MKAPKAPQPLASLLTGALDPIARKRGFSTAEILLRWEAIAGAELATRTRPERIIWPRRGEDETAGVLHLLVRPSAALEVQHATPQIVERVNVALGWRAIRAIKLHQNAALSRTLSSREQIDPLSEETARALDGALASIEEPELRSALRALGAAALRPRTTR
jgi:hypothetical protein